MTFADWITAVDQALKSSGRGFTTNEIDPQTLADAFNAGESPVLFAKRAVAPPPKQAPPPIKYGSQFNWEQTVSVFGVIIGSLLCLAGGVTSYLGLASISALAQNANKASGKEIFAIGTISIGVPLLISGGLLFGFGVSILLLERILKNITKITPG